MARKKGEASVIDGAMGAGEALAETAKRNATDLARRLASQLSQTDIALQDFLVKEFNLIAGSKPQHWTLESGQVATFIEADISYADLRDKTFVRFEVNGRAQEMLAAENLTDLDSLTTQQYFPVIGVRQGDKIEFLDGSRRRMRTLLAEGEITSLRALITDADISESDAKALAASIQTAKEHSLYETGLRLAAVMAETGMKQKELAAALGMSAAKVSRALKASAVDKALIQAIGDVNALSHSDFDALSKIQVEVGDGIADIIELAIEDIGSEQWTQADAQSRIKQLKSVLHSGTKKVGDKSVVTVLMESGDKNTFARKRVKGRVVSFEFGRLPKEKQKQLEAFILDLLKQD